MAPFSAAVGYVTFADKTTSGEMAADPLVEVAATVASRGKQSSGSTVMKGDFFTGVTGIRLVPCLREFRQTLVGAIPASG